MCSSLYSLASPLKVNYYPKFCAYNSRFSFQFFSHIYFPILICFAKLCFSGNLYKEILNILLKYTFGTGWLCVCESALILFWVFVIPGLRLKEKLHLSLIVKEKEQWQHHGWLLKLRLEMAPFHHVSLAKPVISKEGILQGGALQDTWPRTGMHNLLSGNDGVLGGNNKTDPSLFSWLQLLISCSSR